MRANSSRGLAAYPAVTVLRNMTKDLGEKRGALVGQDYWQLPKSPSHALS